MQNLDKLIKWVEFLNKFRNVIRVQKVYGEDRRENDVEHSYIFTMYAWYAFTIYNFPDKDKMDLGKILKYCLVHDLVEAYAGDTFAFAEQAVLDAKKQKEHEAYLKIKEEFTDFPELVELIHAYEERMDLESKFVYALDKTIDPVQFYLDGGPMWKKINVSYDNHMEQKNRKINGVQPAQEIWDKLAGEIEKQGTDKYFIN